MRSIKKILRISLIVCLIVIFLDTTFNGFKYEHLLDVKTWGIYFFYSFVLTTINSLFFWYFNKKVGWEGGGLGRILAASGGAVGLTLVGFFFCRAVHLTIFEEMSFAEFWQNESLNYYFFPLLFTIMVSLFFHSVYFYKALQERRVKEQKIIAGTASAQFDALKNQLDPHFLFNSLNVLSSLIDENPEQAQKFTSSLSKVYRYVLEQKDKELVSLSEEIKFAKTYMNLLKMRFEEGIIFNISSEIENSEVKIVPLSLQLLLENTIKHNVVSPEKPLEIDIYEENGSLVVKNHLQPKEILKGGSGVGLQNIRQRYQLLTDRQVEISRSNSEFIVRLPLLTKLKQVMREPIQPERDDKYLRAKEQVKREKNFYGNLTSYCIVIPVLAIFNYLTADFIWVIFPALGWGLGLLLHAMSVFNFNPIFGKKWEERKIREIMNKNH